MDFACELLKHRTPADKIDIWKDACQSVIDDLLAQYGEFGDQVMTIANEANALYPND